MMRKPIDDLPSDPRERRTARSITWLGLELVIVFVGVYAAFALSEYEASRDAVERREQLQAALVREIRDITSNTRRVADQLPPDLVRFDSALTAGERPPLEPWIEPVRVDTHMWEATLLSGALDLFDVPTVYALSQFYNELNLGFEQLAQLRSLSENVLIPSLGQGPDEFYDADTGALRPKYDWYQYGRARLARLAISITEMGDSLVSMLSPADSLP